VKPLTDIGINTTNKQFQNDIETIIQSAINADVSKMILTKTSIRKSNKSAVLGKKYRRKSSRTNYIKC
jgi:TatD DNase family protein